MKNHGKNTPAQTFTEMVEAGTERRKNSSLYKIQSAAFVDEQLAALVAKTAGELVEAATAEPVSLMDTETVKARTVLYLKSCEASSSFPSVAGLARSMGLSRQALYDCIQRNSPQDTAAWLELCRDAFSDLLSEAGLRNNCNGVVSIFLQKALYGLRESIEVVAKRDDGPLGPLADKAALEQRILESIVIEDDE